MTIKQILCFTMAALTVTFAQAKEHPMGPAIEKNGMEIGAVYLQPITMDMPMGLPANKADAHIELDIHATKDNEIFAEGWWIPYLTATYKLEKIDPKTKKAKVVDQGELMPMIASDGPHYGRNVKFAGAGNYRMTYHILPPGQNKQIHFGRHIDKETAAPEWFAPFDVQWEFPWAGPGEKGSYGN